MRRGVWKILFSIFLFVAAGVVVFLFRDALFKAKTRIGELGEKVALLQEIKKEIVAPPPLRVPVRAVTALLTEEGVVRETNEERSTRGIASIRVNVKLGEAAELKLQDLFAKQYFAHVSPTGEGPSHWAEEAGYAYLKLGENLALGNFENDTALVAAWMESPGHRENILDPRYEEIGVAVGKGIFEGEETWIAVQEFGRPLSACSAPSAALKSQLQENEKALDALEQTLAQKRAELEAMSKRDRKEYNQKAQEYNALVEEFNALLKKTRELVTAYNAQVVSFNTCAAR